MVRNENGLRTKSRSSTSSYPECEHYGDEDERRHMSPRGSSNGQANWRKRSKELLKRQGEVAAMRDKIDKSINAKEMSVQAIQYDRLGGEEATREISVARGER